METFKKLLKDCIAYCKDKDNLVLTAILGGSLAIIFLVFIALICKAAKNKKARKRLAMLEKEKESTPVAPVPEVAVATECKEPPVEEVKAEEPIAVVETSKEVEIVTEAQNPTANEEVAVATEVKEEPSIPAPTPEEKKPTEEKQAEKSASEQESSLIEALKDAPEKLDFYEESETDKQARYKGKWTICRVVTEETTEDDEEMYFFELHASNGEKLLSSEEYTSYAGAIRGIQTHKNNIAKGNFKITLSKKGDYIFKLLSGKNMLLCMGENYPTKARCENAIESTKRFAETAVLDESVQDHVIKIPVEDDSDIEPLPDGYNGKWIVSDTKNNDGEQVYYFELFANNGEKLLSSEEYTTYIGAINGIETHKNNIAKGNFRISLTKRGDYIYKILNGNGQLLCLGEHYKTKRRCLNAVESVKRFAANSPMLVSPYLTK